MKPFAARMGRVAPSATVRMAGMVAAKRAAGVDVVGFAAGEPDFDTPVHVREAAKRALDEGKTHYVPAGGIPELREAVAVKHRDQNAIDQAQASDVIITPTKQAVAQAILALVDDGDEVLLPDPAWVSYDPLVRLAGGTPVYVPLDAANGFTSDIDAMNAAVTKRTKLIIHNSPCNPTGGADEPETIKGLADLCIDHDLYLLSDEIYEPIRYTGTHCSPASLDGMYERTVTVHGLSKSFAMTGWRIGWSLAPEPITKQMMKLQSHTITHPTSFAQYGAVEALTGPQDSVAEMLAAFTRRRQLVMDLLNDMPGVECPEPAGAFYVFPKVDCGDLDSLTIAERLIQEADIGVTPGSAFGPCGEGHLRISYATSEDRIEEGMGRLASWLAKNAKTVKA